MCFDSLWKAKKLVMAEGCWIKGDLWRNYIVCFARDKNINNGKIKVIKCFILVQIFIKYIQILHYLNEIFEVYIFYYQIAKISSTEKKKNVTVKSIHWHYNSFILRCTRNQKVIYTVAWVALNTHI